MRRRVLIEEAFAYFAEVGLSGSTRGLAKRVGITQPLLYRYFPTKESLIEAVYDLVYVNRWRPEWTQILTDRTIKLQDRLNFFYKSYTDIVLTREWLRIYLFAGLNGAELNKWCIGLLEDRIFKPIYRELYAELHAPLPPEYQPSAEEVELIWKFTARSSTTQCANTSFRFRCSKISMRPSNRPSTCLFRAPGL